MRKVAWLIIALVLILMGTIAAWAVTNLDLSGDFLWRDPTSAELANGYSIRRGVVTFVVDSDTSWQVTVKADPDKNYSEGVPLQVYFYDELGGNTGKSVSHMYWRSFVIDNGTMSSISDHTTWEEFETNGTTASPVASGSAGSGAIVGVDYKILVDWKTTPGTYKITLTYTLE